MFQEILGSRRDLNLSYHKKMNHYRSLSLQLKLNSLARIHKYPRPNLASRGPGGGTAGRGARTLGVSGSGFGVQGGVGFRGLGVYSFGPWGWGSLRAALGLVSFRVWG